MKKRLSRGFTLIELLVVIAIIGVLSTLVLLQLSTARAKARDAKRISDVTQIRQAVEQYYDDNNSVYPVAISDALIGQYFASTTVPKDPGAGNPAYGYVTPGASPTKYQIYAELEAKSTGLNTDSDFNTSATGLNWPSGVDGSVEVCTTAANDCVYDLGVK